MISLFSLSSLIYVSIMYLSLSSVVCYIVSIICLSPIIYHLFIISLYLIYHLLSMGPSSIPINYLLNLSSFYLPFLSNLLFSYLLIYPCTRLITFLCYREFGSFTSSFTVRKQNVKESWQVNADGCTARIVIKISELNHATFHQVR